MKNALLVSLATVLFVFIAWKSGITHLTPLHIFVRSLVASGSVIAIITSWSRNRSALWAIVHAPFGWLYVI